ncbi:hypothetical protein SPFM6_00097 [Salmonella phage SPFM6]|nr:hypothetical protein SPFM6_00097 [Salmonella phage SPFM6]
MDFTPANMQIAKRALGFRDWRHKIEVLHKLYDLSIVQIGAQLPRLGEIPTTIELHQKTRLMVTEGTPTINGKVHHRLLEKINVKTFMEYAKRNNYIDAESGKAAGHIIYEYFRSILYEHSRGNEVVSAIFIDKVIPDSGLDVSGLITSAQHGDKVITMLQENRLEDLHVMRSRGLFPVFFTLNSN